MLMGGGILILGLVLLLAGRMPGLGQFPGNLRIERGSFTLYAPLGTMLLLSTLLAVVLSIVARFWR